MPCAGWSRGSAGGGGGRKGGREGEERERENVKMTAQHNTVH